MKELKDYVFTPRMLQGMRFDGEPPCEYQVSRFRELFPKGLRITADNFRKAVDRQLSVWWFFQACWERYYPMSVNSVSLAISERYTLVMSRGEGACQRKVDPFRVGLDMSSKAMKRYTRIVTTVERMARNDEASMLYRAFEELYNRWLDEERAQGYSCALPWNPVPNRLPKIDPQDVEVKFVD